MRKLNRIGQVLKEKEISQYRLHKDSGITYALINSYVQNTRQPSLENLERIAKALKVTAKELLTF